MKEDITKDLDKKPIIRDTKLSMENEGISDPGEYSFESPTKSGKLEIYGGLVNRGHKGDKAHPRG